MSTFNSRRIQAARYCFQQQRGGRDRRLHTHPQRLGELESTAIDDAHTSSSLLQSSMYNGSVTGGYQGLFPTSKPMKSHVRPLLDGSQFQSPAKIFAKLKASVSRNTGGMQTYEKDGPVLLTPRKGAANTREAKWMTNETSTFDPIGVEAMIISPTKSLQHKSPTSFPHRTKYRVPSPVRDTRHGLIERNEYTTVRNPGQVTQQVPLSHEATPLRSSKYVSRTPAIGQPQQSIYYECGGRPIIDTTVCLEKCPVMSPAKMFAYFKRCERKKDFIFPQKTAHRKKDVRMELSDDESQSFFPAKPSEIDRSTIDEPTNSPVRNDVTDDLSSPARCPVVLNNLWLHDSEKALMSKREGLISLENLVTPAKTHMQERKRLQPQEADYVGCSTREAGHRVQSWKRPASPDLKRVEVEYGTRMDRLPEREDNCFQSAATFESCRKNDTPIPARKPLLVLAEDPLVNHSPCVSIPKKHKPIFKCKSAPLEPIQPKQLPVQKGSGCQLAKWTIKYNKEGLYVDGIRTNIMFPVPDKDVFRLPSNSTFSVPDEDVFRLPSNGMSQTCPRKGSSRHVPHPLHCIMMGSDNTPWHSTIIVKRISGTHLRTLSGKTYTLIGTMNMDKSSKFPKWLLSEFVHGFPPEWKKHFERFLSESKTRKDAVSSSAAILPQGPGHRGRGLGPGATKNAEKQSSTPFDTPSCPPPSSGLSSLVLKRSRCGRLIKPPLEFWKGGRVIVDQSMNVTILEDYYENSVCMTKSFTLPTISEPQPPRRDGLRRRCSEATPPSQGPGRPLVDQRQSSAVSVLQRKVKAVSRNHKAKPRAEPEASASSPEEGRARAQGQGASSSSSSTEDREPRPRPRRVAEQRRPVCQASPQAGPSAYRPDPRRRSDNDAPERRISREKKIPLSNKTTVAPCDPESPSDEDIPVRRKGRRKPGRQGIYQSVLHDSSTSLSSLDGSLTVPRKDMGKTVTRTDKGKGRASKKGGRRTVPAAVSAPAQPSKRGDGDTAPKRGALQEEKEDWTEAELASLKMAIESFPKHKESYWVNVAMMVGTRSPEDCQTQHNFQASVKASSRAALASSKNARVSGKKMDPPADQAPPAITARVGTLLRKQQVWQFMDAMPKEDNDDVFSSTAMQGKRFQLPSMTPSRKEQGFVLSDLEPTTPRGSSYCTVQTPPGLHITPGMIRSVNRKKEDNYIFQLQKRMKRSQVNACKLSPPTKTLTPSVKRRMRKGGNMDETSFVIREMFPDNRGAQDDDSGEEQDVYFSDSD